MLGCRRRELGSNERGALELENKMVGDEIKGGVGADASGIKAWNFNY